MANPEHVEVVRAGKRAIDEWRRENPSVRLDLSGADLRCLDLTNVCLTSADFSNANLQSSSFTGAQTGVEFRRTPGSANSHTFVGGVSFDSANVEHCEMHGAFFQETDFSNARLAGSLIWFSRFSRCYFNNAHFAGCVIGTTNWDHCDLSVAGGLDRVVHAANCGLTHTTLRESGGQLPESFLRGCGLSDEFIQYIPSLFSDSAFQFYSCFISYSHADKQFARQLHDRLQGKGIRCWLDEHQLNPGDDIYERVDRGIRVWDKVLLCCSEHSLNSWWVDREINTAIEKEQEFHKERGERVLKIIPLNLDGSLFEWEHSQASEIRRRLAADFTDWKSDADKFEHEFEKVVRALRTDSGRGGVDPVGRL